MRSAVVIEQERNVQADRLRTLVGEGDADLTDVERGEVDRLKSEIERLSGDAVRARFIEDLATRAADGNGGGGAGDGDPDGRAGSDMPVDQEPDYTAAKRGFSMLRALGRELGLRRDSGLEDEVMAEMRSRDGVEYEGVPVPREAMATRSNVTTAAATGGGLVMDEHRAQNFIEVLRTRLVLDRVGATVLDGLMGSVTIPGQSKAAVATWAAEDAALAQSDPVFTSKAMSAKKVGMFTSLTREVIRQASPDVEMLVMSDFAAGIARAMDAVALVGGGTSEPTGIAASSASPLARVGTSTNGLALSFEDVLKMIVEVDDDDAPEDARAFVVNAKTAGKLFSIPWYGGDNNNRWGASPLLNPEMPRDAGMMLGERVVRSNRVKSDLSKGTGRNLSHMFYGNWSGLLVGYWGGLDLLANPFESAAYKAGNVLIRGIMNADLVIRRSEEFVFFNDLITTITTSS